jgi:hypothetical protein
MKIMRRVHTQIDIEAPVQIVWDLITDLDNYAAWNPFVVMGKGPIQEGEKITVRAEPKGAPGKTFRPVITKLAPGRELRWLGHFLLPGLVDGEHIHILEPLGETRTRYIHDDEFSGWLLPAVWTRLELVTRIGFEKMNAALKKRAEAKQG